MHERWKSEELVIVVRTNHENKLSINVAFCSSYIILVLHSFNSSQLRCLLMPYRVHVVCVLGAATSACP